MNNQVAVVETSASMPSSVASQAAMGFATVGGFELLQRVGKMLAATSLVPKEYQGNQAMCALAANIAQRIGADPLMVMQNLVVVHNRPTWSSQFLIATVNTCGRFSALRYEFFGEEKTDNWGCRAWAVEKATGEKLVGTDITIALAKSEGWHGKNGSKWKTMPQQMLMYRAGAWWARAYAPELSMGLHTADEIRDGIIDVEAVEVDVSRPALGHKTALDQMSSFAGMPEEEPVHDEDGVIQEESEPATKPEPEAKAPKLSPEAMAAINKLSAAETLQDFQALNKELPQAVREEIGGDKLLQMSERFED